LCFLLPDDVPHHVPFPTPSFIFSFSFMCPPPSHTYTLSLHDALPIYRRRFRCAIELGSRRWRRGEYFNLSMDCLQRDSASGTLRSEEHTSELQSRFDLVCRLLLEKKNIRKF